MDVFRVFSRLMMQFSISRLAEIGYYPFKNGAWFKLAQKNKYKNKISDVVTGFVFLKRGTPPNIMSSFNI